MLPIEDYLVYGMDPGSFYRAVLANDLVTAIGSCHPAQSLISLKCLVGWLVNATPEICRGSYAHVDGWQHMSSNERRLHLERCKLIYTELEELELALRSDAYAKQKGVEDFG